MSDIEKNLVSFEYTRGLGELFFKERLSLIASTYQAQRVMLISGESNGKVAVLNRTLPRPMGIALSNRELAIGCKNEIWFFSISQKVLDLQGVLLPYDLVFLPRRAHVTGDVLIHQLAYVNEKAIFTNTRFSCLSEVSQDHSFSVVWRPPFISQLLGDDRCHLNGMAIRDREVRYVSMLAQSDQPSGWREQNDDQGIIFDLRLNKVIVTSLAMPHSPCWYNDKLWCLESACGDLVAIDVVSGKKEQIIKVAGYARGLAIHGNFAFIGISKFRDKSLAARLSTEQVIKDPVCAIKVLDLRNREIVGTIEFKGLLNELFDIQVLPGVLKPFMVGFEEELIDQIFSIDLTVP
jgi:uncharacterized protein (TIGR03032 family)